MKTTDLRAQFPALSRKVYGKDLVYLDNAATSQKPLRVLEFADRMARLSNGNIHRAVHMLSAESTVAYEEARNSVMKYINAPSAEEVIFTSGTTASINLVAFSFSEAFLEKGDRIIVTEAEHHSNIVPWQLACGRKGAELVVLPVSDDGTIDPDMLEPMLDSRVKLVSVCQISNVLGIVNPVDRIIEIAHRHSVPVMVDGAQGIVHGRVDVQAMDCDFYVFSGHKLYAPTGTGILYGKRRFLDAMPPYMGGGDMVGTVSFSGTTYAELPLKFEAGTSNFISHACWTPAIETASIMAEQMEIEWKEEERRIKEIVFESVAHLGEARILGTGKGDLSDRIALFSIVVDGVNSSDMAQIMDKMGFALRSGMMCAEPLLARFGQTSVLRASFLPYNTAEEALMMTKALERAVGMLR